MSVDVELEPLGDPDAEDALVASILFAVDPEQRALILERVRREVRLVDVGSPRRRALLAAMFAMDDAGEQPDLALLPGFLESRRLWDAIGGREELLRLASAPANPLLSDVYARRVVEVARRRGLLHLGQQLRDDARTLAPADVLERARARLDEIDADRCARPPSMAEALELLHAEIRSPAAAAATLSTGLVDLDRDLGGVEPGQTVVVAGRPGMGKTALLLSIALHVALVLRRPVAFFSLEMSRSELLVRMLAAVAGLDTRQFAPGNSGILEDPRVVEAETELREARILVDDRTGLTPGEVRAAVRRERLRRGLEAVFVDHIGEMRAPDRAERWSLTEQTGAIAGELKDVAKDLGVAVFAACQLNRDVESRKNKRPTLADLRQSGRIEEVANKALLLYRAHYYDQRAAPGVAEITIAKNRGGVSGRRVEVLWRPECQRFGNLTRREEPR